MKLLIEMPTWLGDAVMASPAIENLLKQFSDADVYVVGSPASIGVLKSSKNFEYLCFNQRL